VKCSGHVTTRRARTDRTPGVGLAGIMSVLAGAKEVRLYPQVLRLSVLKIVTLCYR
jgi:hypothetical protein